MTKWGRWKSKKQKSPKIDSQKEKKIQLNPYKRWKDKKEREQKEIERQKQMKVEKEKQEKKGKIKKIFTVIILIVAFIISIFSWPLTLPTSLLALWYFTKKKPRKKYNKYAKHAAIISVFGLITFFILPSTSYSPDPVAEADKVEEVADVENEEQKQKELEQKEKEQKAKEQKEREEREQAAREEAERKEKELSDANPNKSDATQAPTKPTSIPEGKEDATVNDNIPHFSNEDITSTEVYHQNGSLDSLGRVTAANAVVGVEIMPSAERGDIGHHKPTGWNQRRYAGIGAGGWLFNRSHLIGHQMTGNDDYVNLMTGTRWFNMRMLEYENFVANYVESTENHVRYRVTPVFEGDNLVASGAYMEGFSIEDNGEALMFNVYVPNVQPGVEISYVDGSSVGPEGPAESATVKDHPSKSNSSSSNSSGSQESKPKPKPEPKPEPKPTPSGGNLSSVDTNGNGTVTIQEAKDAGFSMPITNDHWLYEYMIDRDGDGMVGE